jgi:flavin-dependent dehydrogenase
MNTRANREVQSDVVGRHTVVLGGSLAGLLAARVLSDHFERVTLIERDAYTDAAEVRKGMPQANHVHGLLLRPARPIWPAGFVRNALRKGNVMKARSEAPRARSGRRVLYETR